MFIVSHIIEADVGCLRMYAVRGYYVHWNDLQPFGDSEELDRDRWSVTHVMAWRRGKRLDPQSAMEAAANWIPGPLMPILSVEELTP